MKTHEAFEQIEARAATLDLPPWEGARLLRVEKLSMVARHHGAVVRALDDKFRAKEITPEFYRDCWFQLIDEYARHLIRVRLEKVLVGDAS